MPPRYAYWTIIVDGQPTAFRSGSLEDIQPTFNRLKDKHPTAELRWWQNGKLWPTRLDAQESMRFRGERGRERDPSQASGRGPGSGVRDPESDRPERAWNAKPEWKTRSSFKAKDGGGSGAPVNKPSYAKASTFAKATADKPEGKPEWKPKGSFTPEDKPKRSFAPRGDKPSWKSKDDKPAWKPKGTFKPKEAGHASGWSEKPGFSKDATDKPAWKPKGGGGASGFSRSREDKPSWKPGGSARDNARSSFRPKSYTPKVDDGMTRSSRVQSRNDKLEWKPASAKATARQGPASSRPGGPNAGFAKSDPDAPKRKWVPKAEYKKSLGIEAKRDDKWRPGGEHVDPKQKYKDAKKAKWTKIKSTIRARSSKPRKPKDE